jgi:hypothetical protein
MMNSRTATLLLQALAVMLCAWGLAVILQIAAMAGGLLLGTGPGSVPDAVMLATAVVIGVHVARLFARRGTERLSDRRE